MSELTLHNIKKIDIFQDFIHEGKDNEFAVIKILIESPEDPDVKNFTACFFIKNDTEMNIRNLLLAHNHDRVNPSVADTATDPEDMFRVGDE